MTMTNTTSATASRTYISVVIGTSGEPAAHPAQFPRLLSGVDVEDFRPFRRRAIDRETVGALRNRQALRFRLFHLAVESALAAQRVTHGAVALVTRVFVYLVVRL